MTAPMRLSPDTRWNHDTQASVPCCNDTSTLRWLGFDYVWRCRCASLVPREGVTMTLERPAAPPDTKRIESDTNHARAVSPEDLHT